MKQTTVAAMIGERAARVIVNTTPHGINGDIFTGDYNKLVANIKSQMLQLLNDVGALKDAA